MGYIALPNIAWQRLLEIGLDNLWNLLCQLDRPEFFQEAWLDGASIRFEVLLMSHVKRSIPQDLTSKGREKVQAVFSQGGFAWVQGPAAGALAGIHQHFSDKLCA